MYWRLISLEEVIQIWITSSKDNNLQYFFKVYCRELGKYLMQFDALEKKCNETANCNQIVTNGHQYINTTEDEKLIFWINAHIPIEKESHQDWDTPIHLKNNGQHIKVPLIFWFLSWFSTVFITNCELMGMYTYWTWTNWAHSFMIPKIYVDVWHWMQCTPKWQPW